jgi:hypothetical protein
LKPAQPRVPNRPVARVLRERPYMGPALADVFQIPRTGEKGERDPEGSRWYGLFGAMNSVGAVREPPNVDSS